MIEPTPKRRVVNAQTSNPSPSPATRSQSQARAKVDVSSIVTPAVRGRPAIKAKMSTASLRSNASNTTSRNITPAIGGTMSSRGQFNSPILPQTPSRSPAISSQPLRLSSRQGGLLSSAAVRARATATQRVVILNTPDGGLGSPPQIGGSQSRPESRSGPSDRGRVKVKPQLVAMFTPVNRSISRSPTQLSPVTTSFSNLGEDPWNSGGKEWYEMERSASHQSSPGQFPHPSIPLHLYPALGHVVQQHPSASCPPSPPLASTSLMDVRPRYTRQLPINPNGPISSLQIPIPPSPEMRTVSLPIMTPRRLSSTSQRTDDSAPGGSDPQPESSSFDGDTWSGSTAVDRDASVFMGKGEEGGGDPGMDEVLGEDAEEAKVNRKIADLEISNASLLAINRSLEATKSKQRGEIIRLRRALREATEGTDTALSQTRSLASPVFLLSPSGDDEEQGYFDDELEDPELEQRWEKIQDLVGVMQRRGETAVKKGQEEPKVAAQRVLDWTEVEVPATPEPELAADEISVDEGIKGGDA